MSERAEWRRRCVAAEVALARLQQERERLRERVLSTVDSLFVNGSGDEAHRLVLLSRDGRDLGGWGKAVVLDKFNALFPPTETQEPTR